MLVGCTPTKTMAASDRIAHLARRAADYGVTTGEVSVDVAAAILSVEGARSRPPSRSP